MCRTERRSYCVSLCGTSSLHTYCISCSRGWSRRWKQMNKRDSFLRRECAGLSVGHSLYRFAVHPVWDGLGSVKCPMGENVALKGKATQSDLHGMGLAYNAIDGNRDGYYFHGSCTHTKAHLNPWWRVDLLQNHKVFSVVITNTVDSVPSRLNGAEIRIGTSLQNNGINNPRCAVISSIPAGFSKTFECYGMEGRYVTVVIPGRAEYLTLCEVEVYGSPLD